jgi:hypothetical protein
MMSDSEEQRRQALLDAEQAHRRKLAMEQEIANFESIKSKNLTELEKFKEQTNAKILAAQAVAMDELESEKRVRTMQQLEERAQLELQNDEVRKAADREAFLIRQKAQREAEVILKKAEARLREAEKIKREIQRQRPPTHSQTAGSDSATPRVPTLQIIEPQPLPESAAPAKVSIPTPPPSLPIAKTTPASPSPLRIEAHPPNGDLSPPITPPTAVIDAALRAPGNYDEQWIQLDRERRIRRGIIGGTALGFVLMNVFFPAPLQFFARGVYGVFSGANSSEREFMEKVQQERGRKPAAFASNDAFKANYTDNVLFTRDFLARIRRPEFESAWHKEVQRFLTQELRLPASTTNKVIAAEAVLIRELEKAAKKIREDQRQQSIDRMRAIEVVFSNEIKDVLGSDSHYERFLQLAERFYNQRLK